MVRTATFILSMCLTFVGLAGVIPDTDRNALLQKTLSSRFWGHAKLADGSFVQPESEQDRRTMPISENIANKVFDVGEVSGYAEWCGLDWQSHFLSMTASARNSGLKEKQLAFIGVIHGTTQGIVSGALKSKQCGDRERSKVMDMMKSTSNQRF